MKTRGGGGGGHGRYMSQPQLLSQQKECISVFPKTIILDKLFQPKATSFYQKYMQQINGQNIQKSVEMRKQQKWINQDEVNKSNSQNYKSEQSYLPNYISQQGFTKQQSPFSKRMSQTFTEYMETKYKQLNTQQLQKLPQQFLRTFNLQNDELLKLQDSVIEWQSNSPQNNQSNFSINNDQGVSNFWMKRGMSESSPSNKSFQLSQNTQTNASMTPKLARKTQSKRFNVTFGFTNSQDERFDITNNSQTIKKNRKKIILNELSKEVINNQNSSDNIQIQHKMENNLINSKSPQNSSQIINFEQCSIQQKHAINSQSNHYRNFSNNKAEFDRNDEKDQIDESCRNSNEGQNNKQGEEFQIYNKQKSYSLKSQDSQCGKNEQKSKKNKFILLCNYCRMQQEHLVNLDLDEITQCKCKGNQMQNNIKNKQTSSSTLQLRRSIDAKPQLSDNIPKHIPIHMSNHHHKSKSKSLQLPESPSDQDVSEQIVSSQHQQGTVIKQSDIEITYLRDNQNSSKLGEDMSEPFQKSFQKCDPIINHYRAQLKIQDASRKKNLITSFHHAYPNASKKILSKCLETTFNPQKMTQHNLAINARSSICGGMVKGGGEQKQGGSGLLTMKYINQQNKRSFSFSTTGSKQQQQQTKSSESLKSNTLKKIIELQREMEEYQNKIMLQDEQEIDLSSKKKLQKGGNQSQSPSNKIQNQSYDSNNTKNYIISQSNTLNTHQVASNPCTQSEGSQKLTQKQQFQSNLSRIKPQSQITQQHVSSPNAQQSTQLQFPTSPSQFKSNPSQFLINPSYFSNKLSRVGSLAENNGESKDDIIENDSDGSDNDDNSDYEEMDNDEQEKHGQKQLQEQKKLYGDKLQKNISKTLKLNLKQVDRNQGLFDRDRKRIDSNKTLSPCPSSSPHPPPLPKYHLSDNLEELKELGSTKNRSSFSHNGNRHVSIYSETKKQEQDLLNQKSLYHIGKDKDKLMEQFIKTLFFTYANTLKDGEEDDDDDLNYILGKERKPKATININQQEGRKTDIQGQGDILKEQVKRLRRMFKEENIQIELFIESVKNYMEHCFCELSNMKDEHFLKFKMEKRTFQLVIKLFVYIFQQNNYSTEAIAQAENSLKKHYKLITFLPCFQEELGGSNFLNKIIVKFSATLKSRLIEIFKNVESEEQQTRKEEQLLLLPTVETPPEKLQKNPSMPLSSKLIPDEDKSQQRILPSYQIISPENQKLDLQNQISISQNQNISDKDQNQINRQKKYSVIESNVESHFELVFQRASQRRISQQLIQSQLLIKEGDEEIERYLIYSSKIKGKYSGDEIEELNIQIQNLMRFIYHNNSYSQFDMSNLLDKLQIKSICKVFDINYSSFFEIKEILWTTLQDFHIFPTIILRILEQLERYRYIISQVPIIEHLCSDPQVRDAIIREMEWRLSCLESQTRGIFENQHTLKTFCETLISEYIYRVKSIYNIVIFFKALNLSETQFDFISEEFKKAVSLVGFDDNFCQDLEFKFMKLKYKINMIPSPLKIIGGYSAIHQIIQIAHNMISNPQFENEYTEYIKKFPEDLHNLLYELPLDQIKSDKKYDKKPGLKLFEFLIFCLLSVEDCYSIQDLRAGMQVFHIEKTTLIHWKSLIEQSMHHLNYPQPTIQHIMNSINTQFLIIFKEYTEFQDLNPPLLF